MRSVILALMTVLFALSARGQDYVDVRYIQGMMPISATPGGSLQNEMVIRIVDSGGESGKAVQRAYELCRQNVGEKEVNNFGTDASYIRIAVVKGNGKYTLGSRHPLYRTDDNAGVPEHGVESLGDRNKEQVLASQSDRYKRFVFAFDQIMRLVMGFYAGSGGAP